MPGTLYVVATPIGNLEDVTLRALRVLREVALIAAEDTRRTARLLQHYSISTRTTSLHEHNERSKTPSLIDRLLAGDSVALVSDAGTPLISDPGSHLVTQAHQAGIRVEPIPGPNAAVAALSASGLAHGEFVFAGFPPHRSTDRKRWLQRLAPEARAMIFYEAPHRIRPTLEDMLQAFGDRVVALGRELTKAHENLVIRQISGHLAAELEERGEFTIIVAAAPPRESERVPPPSPQELAREIGQLIENEAIGRREAIRTLARRHGLSNREIFNLLEDAKK
ncbi:MAG TPA: 16S rRNA (cytidine(1402)-2'-O)-methyltransferase [Vicinamibacterales bacterium]|jgi:16S rRNA (cytidine1402-2'-O)-methyltransferase|nr:16S rRNA (cytidine(1402)-2'-O)-methyltransferase [Vicinamibacterales bacterium]